ncbi:MAG: serine/threonine protein kinase [Gammaproteobacteria bacterium]|nr:serine/threonine protein kinase [Gammaproteobacteria bacterium]
MPTTTTQYTQSLPIGCRVLWYEVRAVLGQGGFGITYLMHDTNLDQAVAIKEYLPSLFATRGAEHSIVPTSTGQQADFDWGLTRFVEEGRLLARLDHPAVVRAHSVFEANGTAYLVMRYEEGETLDALLKRARIMPESLLAPLLMDVMDGLEHIHANGYIHRDVKPSNIYLRRDGHAMLLDFGAARQALQSHTRTFTSLVSPGYAPFEQYRTDGTGLGPWTDIYGLGATAYRAITGRAPIPSVDRSHRILDGTGDLMPRLTAAGIGHYSFQFLAAVDRALAFRELERPVTVTAWRAMFEDPEPVTAQPPATPASATKDPASFANRQPGTSSASATVGARSGVDHAPRNEEHVVTAREPLTARTAVESGMALFRHKLRIQLGVGATALCAAFIAFLIYQPPVATALSNNNPLADHGGKSPLSAVGARLPALPATENTVNTQFQIATLLRRAAADRAAFRLTTPPGNNALEKYRAVLRFDPRNGDAKTGIDQIVGRYLDLAAAAATRREFAAANDFLRRANDANPSDRRLREAFVALARSQASS